jgi:endonuclease/exonuclease/phosphatase (EEP) superfamily protein YafD
MLARLSWAYLAGACAVAAVMWGLGDRWWAGTVILFMGRWAFLLPLAVLVPPALALRPSLLAPLALAALVVAGPVMGFRTGWRRWLPRPAGGDARPGEARLRVVTFNVDGGEFMTTELRRLLAAWAPDVVALQECGEALSAATRDVPGWYGHSENGLCLLSRFPITEAQAMGRAALERVKQDDAAGIGGAGYVVSYAIETPRGPVALTNLHLETPRKGLERLMALDFRRLRENTELRDVESALARRWVERPAGGGRRAPFLVVGDFNTPVESRIFRRYWGDLPDAFSQAGVGLGMTKYNGWIRARIDHVLLGPSWRVDSVRIGEDIGSDHRPLIADLTLDSGR